MAGYHLYICQLWLLLLSTKQPSCHIVHQHKGFMWLTNCTVCYTLVNDATALNDREQRSVSQQNTAEYEHASSGFFKTVFICACIYASIVANVYRWFSSWTKPCLWSTGWIKTFINISRVRGGSPPKSLVFGVKKSTIGEMPKLAHHYSRSLEKPTFNFLAHISLTLFINNIVVRHSIFYY